MKTLKSVSYFLLFVGVTLCLFNPSNIIAQSNDRWTTKTFESKCFIKNNGQFDTKVKLVNASSLISNGRNDVSVKYGLIHHGVEIYFTNTGIVYRRDRLEKKGEEKNEVLLRKSSVSREESEEYDRSESQIPQFLEMNWLGANPAAEIIAEGRGSAYHTYYIDNVSVRAYSYTKLTYKNLYPNIDIKYYFPEDKEGFKYDIILHPGAEVASIQQMYKGAKEIKQDSAGNTIISGWLGEIVDHAPVAFLDNGEGIDCSFNLEDNIVRFNLGIDRIQQKVVIDPWVQTPTFEEINSAFEIARDSLDNIYIYGDLRFPTVQKYNSNGVLQWTQQVNDNPDKDRFGDIAVTPGGDIYVSTLLNSRGIIRLSSEGDIVDFFSLGNTSNRLAFNCDYTVLYVSGRGTTMNAINITAGTTFPTKTLMLEGGQIMSLTRGNSGDLYGLANRQSSDQDSAHLFSVNGDLNKKYSVPANQFLYNVQDQFDRQYNLEGGLNGITTNEQFIYTTNGNKLVKYDFQGNVLDSVQINDGILQQNSGVVVDGCGNIYCGSQLGLVVYDSLFNLVKIDTTPGAVYDITVGGNGKIYSCGDGFVKETDLSICSKLPTCPCLSVAGKPACDALGKGKISLDITGAGSLYTYQWSTGATSAEVDELDPGEYSVEVTSPDGCVISATFTVDSSIDVYSCNCIDYSTLPSCVSGAEVGTIEAIETLGFRAAQPFTYQWSTGEVTQGSDAVTGLKAGVYSVVVTDTNGCQSTIREFRVNERFSGEPFLFNTFNNCLDENNGGVSISTNFDSLSSLFYLLSSQSSAFPIEFIWDNGDTLILPGINTPNLDYYTNLTPGKHPLVIKDTLGCIIEDTIEIPEAKDLNFTLELSTGLNDTCTNFVEAAISGGSGYYTYQWSNGDTSNALTIDYSAPITLSVFIVDDTLSCYAIDSINLLGNVLRVDSVELNDLFCEEVNTGAITLDVFTHDFSQLNISWLNDASQNIANDSIQLSNLSEGDYTISISDESGCLDTTLQLSLQRVFLEIFSNMTDTNICYGDTLLLSVTGLEEYEWFEEGVKISENSSVSIKPERSIQYWVLGEERTCKIEDTIQVNFCDLDPLIYIPNAFSPNQDGENDFLSPFSNVPLYQMELSIYDRWGKLLFTGNSLFDKWDGTWKGNPLNEGVYVYIFTGKQKEQGEEIRKTGNVTLLR